MEMKINRKVLSGPDVAGALNRISWARKEECSKKEIISLLTYRLARRHLRGNLTDTLEEFAVIADAVIRESEKESSGYEIQFEED